MKKSLFAFTLTLISATFLDSAHAQALTDVQIPPSATFQSVPKSDTSYQYAGDIEKKEKPKALEVKIGAAAIYAPAYAGADKNSFVVVPAIDAKYEQLFLNYQDGFGYNVFENDQIRFAPIVKLDPGRSEDGGNPLDIFDTSTRELNGLGDVDMTVELGGLFEYRFSPEFASKVELRQGIGGHEGMIAEAKLDYNHKVGDIILSMGPRVKFADDNYMSAYFGVDPAQSARTGYRRYSPDSGLYSYGLGASAAMPINDRVSLTGFLGYDRLATEVAKSPLVEGYGDANQFIAGTAVSYDLGL